jgi:sialate O-acetylesterase
MIRSNVLTTLCATLALAALPALAEVKLPAVLAEHMVVQRGLPVHVWGTAAPGEAVTVTFHGATRAATMDRFGRFEAYLPPCEAGGPFSLKVQGTNTIEFTDVLCGDVWVASGQSNMEFQLSHAANAQAEIAAANYPKLRLFFVKNNTSEYPVDDVSARTWTAATPETVGDFSAIAYLFGRNLLEKENVPVGLISSSWGGTPAESWTSLPALASDATLMPAFALWGNRMRTQSTTLLERAQDDLRYEAAVAKAKAAGQTPPWKPWHENDRNCWRPGTLFNAMIAPLTPFPIRGVIWYQGESNADPERASWYDRLFMTMIRDWREAWHQGDFPFLYVQIANWKTADGAQWWPLVRDNQRRTLALSNTAMAVTIDIGEPGNIHPKNKQDVGARLALAARALAYGEKIEYSGPLFRQATRDGVALRVWFDHLGTGLRVHGERALGFEISGADHKWHPAEARLDGDTVLVVNSAVPDPVAARYAWKDAPECNLFNAEGLPASPFTSAIF